MIPAVDKIRFLFSVSFSPLSPSLPNKNKFATPRTRIIGTLSMAKKLVNKNRMRRPVPNRKDARLTFRLFFIISSVSIKNIAADVGA